MSKTIALLVSTSVTAALAAQVQNNAGLGAIYRTVQLDPLTGNNGHLGCAVRLSDGHIFVSARGVGGSPPHKIYELSPTGDLIGSFNQPSVHDTSLFGMRDLAVDDSGNLIGGSENGISVIDSHTGAAIGTIAARGGNQSVNQPIRGAALAQLGCYRGLAFDSEGNGGAGSLWSANFNSSLIEFDLAGNILQSWPVPGANPWSIYGIALDPITNRLLVNSAPNAGRISEIDPATGQLTGRSFPMALPGNAGSPQTVQGGLSLAVPSANVHERWSSVVNLVELTQNDTSDVLTIRRLHLYVDDPPLTTPPTPHTLTGWTEINLQSAVGATATPDLVTEKTFGNGATLRFKVNDPLNSPTPALAWVFINMYGDAAVDGYTDLTGLVPGVGYLKEHRCLNPFSSPSSPFFFFTTAAVGATVNLPTPSGIFAVGDLIRMQAVHLQLEIGGALPLASTNEVYFRRQ